jgi:hypothetical protein
MAAVKLVITGVGAYLPVEGSDPQAFRAYDRGEEVSVDDATAKRLIDGGVAMKPADAKKAGEEDSSLGRQIAAAIDKHASS